MSRCQDGGTTGLVSAKDQVLTESASQLGYCEVKGLATLWGLFHKSFDFILESAVLINSSFSPNPIPSLSPWSLGFQDINFWRII